MTVQELAQCLTKFPPDMQIVVEGYEAGFDNVIEAKTIRLAFDANEHWYYGRHKQSEKTDASEAVLIQGDRRT